MRLWVSVILLIFAGSGCSGNTKQPTTMRLHGNWQCTATSINPAGDLTVHIDYTHRINSHTLKSATETQMHITQRMADQPPKLTVVLLDSAENIVIHENSITYTPYSANLLSIERDDLQMLAKQAGKDNLLKAVRQTATAEYHFEGQSLHLYFPESDMTSLCEASGSSS